MDQKRSYVAAFTAARDLLIYPPEYVLCHSFALDQFDKGSDIPRIVQLTGIDGINELLERLTPENMRLFLISRSFADTATEADRKTSPLQNT